MYKRQQLEKAGVRILGTTPDTIDLAEDRDRFNQIMEKIGVPMPESGMAVNVEEAIQVADRIGYPLMVRPSYVLGGRGMEVVYDQQSLETYMAAAVGVTPDRPILIDRFLSNAMETEADAIADGSHAFVPAIMEHIDVYKRQVPWFGRFILYRVPAGNYRGKRIAASLCMPELQAQ